MSAHPERAYPNGSGLGAPVGCPAEADALAESTGSAVQVSQVLLAEFRERVLAAPDKPVAVDAERTLTYRELDEWSSSMAHGLLSAPATAQPVVAIVSWLGVEAIALQQAVLKAGLVGAPLDPREPDEVLLASAERLGARMVLVDQERAASLTPLGARSAVTAPRDLDTGTTTAPDVVLDPALPIFLGATSGSTGKSRSVAFPQSLTKVMDEMRLVHDPDARVGVLLPPMFVAANAPITSAWRSGATAYCYDLSTQPVAGLPDWVADVGLTAFALTPSLVRLAFEPWLERGRTLPAMSRVSLAGESLTGNDVRVLRRIFPNATFVNVYGAADTALVSRFEIPPDLDVADGPVPIGAPLRPIEIVDDAGVPVPPGEVGIITAVGDWLPTVLESEGPVDLADLDLARVRRASTGDLGRLLPDGSLELLGRADHRVKVRGQMVDPERVEAALISLDDVQDAVVSPVPRGSTTELVAHVVPSSVPAPQARALRVALRGSLPSFMVPSTFVVVPELPRLGTGKANRRALRDLAAVAVPDRLPSPAPSGPAEELIAAAFATILGLESVGRDDDFFDLGGDSLSAVELMTSLTTALGFPVEAAIIVEEPTVAGLAGWVAARRRRQAGEGRVGSLGGLTTLLRSKPPQERRILTVRAEGSATPLYVVPGGGNNIFQMRALAAALADRPVHELVPKGLGARTWPNYSVESMAQHHLASLASVQGRYVLGGYSFGALVAWQVARELNAQGRPPACLVLLDPSGFSASTGRVSARLRTLATRSRERVRAAADGGPSDNDEVVAAERPARPGRRGDLASAARTVRTALPRRPLRAAWVELNRATRLWVPPLTAGVLHHEPDTESHLFHAISRYAARRYRPRPVGGPVVLVVSEDRYRTNGDELASGKALVNGKLAELVVAGDHVGILRPPNVRDVAAQLDDALVALGVDDRRS